jgi:hypothetical protein
LEQRVFGTEIVSLRYPSSEIRQILSGREKLLGDAE